jgi:hypothetical protein
LPHEREEGEDREMRKRALVFMLLGIAAAAAFAQDFKQGEVLCAAGEKAADQTFRAAKVLKAASDATKNQAQVLYVADGSKEWADFVIPTHPAKKAELIDGAVVFYPEGWAEYDTMSAGDYRSTNWKIGHVTSLDEMFKSFVEVDGSKYTWKFIRIPDNPAGLESSGE